MNLYKDILPKINEYRKIIENQSVLFISHKGCLDGIGSVIIAEKYFPNFKCVTIGYNCVDEYLEKLDSSKIDLLFMVDICPKDLNTLNKFKDYIILDHHESIIEGHNPDKKILIYDDECGTKLMKRFTEAVLKKELPELDEFVECVNDYDMWLHKTKYGKFLQFIFFELWDDKFKEEIKKDFDVKRLFKDYGILYKDHIKKIDECWNSLDIEEINLRYRIAHIHLDNYINDICERVLEKENFDIVICHKNNELHSIRVNKNTDFDSGALLTKLHIGGGHPKASAFKALNKEEYLYKLKLILDEIGPF